MPEVITTASILQYVSRSRFWLKFRFFFEPGIVVTNVPLLVDEHSIVPEHVAPPVEPERSVVLIPVSGVHDATAAP